MWRLWPYKEMDASVKTHNCSKPSGCACCTMSFLVSRIAILFFISTIWIPDVDGKNHKIRIIVPHKIKYIHHHHPNLIPTTKKFRLGSHNKHQHLHLRNEDESGEDVSEERYGQQTEEDEDEGFDTRRRGSAYYAIPTSEYSAKALRFVKKPPFLYSESHQRTKLPQSYDYLRYKDYLRRPRYPGQTYPHLDFDYK